MKYPPAEIKPCNVELTAFWGCAVEYRFKADEWTALTKEQQLARCLAMANEARTLARNALPNMQEGYVALATQWLALAAEIEKAD